MNPNENLDQQPVPTSPPTIPPTDTAPIAPITSPQPASLEQPQPFVSTPQPMTPVPDSPAQPVFDQPNPVPAPNPVSPSFGQSETALPQTSVPPVSSFGSASNVFPTQQPEIPQQKKGINKKIIIIIAIAVLVIGGVVAAILLVPKITGNSSGTSLLGEIGQQSSLTTYNGEGYSLSIPQNFKEITNTSPSTTPGVTSKAFNKTGQKSDTPASLVSASSGPYTGTSQGEMSKLYSSIIKTPIPDSETTKDNSFSKKTISGLEAFVGKGTSIDKGIKKTTAYSVYVLGKDKLYFFIINVLPEDESSIDADAIIKSIKVTQ